MPYEPLNPLALPLWFNLIVLRYAGIEIEDCGSRTKVPIHCPLGTHADKTKSAFVTSSNVFYCSVCTPDGGWTAKQLAEALRVDWRSILPRRDTRSDRHAPRAKLTEIRDVWERAHARTLNDELVAEDQDVYRYLSQRGLGGAWNERTFGVLSSEMSLPPALARWPKTGHKLVAPLYNLKGEIANLQGRSIGPADPKVLFPKGLQAKHTVFANRLGIDLLQGGCADSSIVLLAEGLTDFLALSIVATVPVLSAPGTGMVLGSLGPWSQGRKLLLTIDRDNAGTRAVAALRRVASAHGIAGLEWARWLGSKDVAEFLQRNGPDELSRVLDAMLAKVRR